MSINNPDLRALFNRFPQKEQVAENPFVRALARIEQNPQPQSDEAKKMWIGIFSKILADTTLDHAIKKQQLEDLVNLSLRLGTFSDDELTAELKKIGIERKTESSRPVVDKEKNDGTFPKTDYEKIANLLPLDENNPPKPDKFITPAVTNLFNDTDEPTLAGKVIASMYADLIKRPSFDKFDSDQINAQLAESKEMVNDFVQKIASMNSQRDVPISISRTRTSGTDGFHFNSENINAGKEFLFYFGKSKANYKKEEPEVRAYVTVDPSEKSNIHTHFMELTMRLYDAGIDFSAKAASLFGVIKRTDNMVFYISISDQPKASEIIKQFLQEKRITQAPTNVDSGKVMAAVPSKQDGLSWAMEPDQSQTNIWQKVSGSTTNTSFNAFVTTMCMPTYLDRIAQAHRNKGDLVNANIFTQESQRVKQYTQS